MNTADEAAGAAVRRSRAGAVLFAVVMFGAIVALAVVVAVTRTDTGDLERSVSKLRDQNAELQAQLEQLRSDMADLQRAMEELSTQVDDSQLSRRASYEDGEDRAEFAHASTIDGLTTTTEAARLGSASGVAVLHPGDEPNREGYRSEWNSGVVAPIGEEYWHGISYYLPADWNQGANPSFDLRIIFQFHTPGSVGWSPIYGFLVVDGDSGPYWSFYRKESPRGPNVDLWTEDVQLETWIDFAINVKWTTEPDGFIRVYRDQQLVYEATGIATLARGSDGGPYSKWGIYGQPTRILFDEVRIAEGPDKLAAVSPGYGLWLADGGS